MQFLKPDLLKKLNIPRLQNVLKKACAAEKRVYLFAGRRCCELCCEYIGDDWENDVEKVAAPFTSYKKLVISVLEGKQSQIRTRR